MSAPQLGVYAAGAADWAQRTGRWQPERSRRASRAAAARQELAAGDAARAHEARRILALLSAQDYVVPLDEQGEQFSTLELAHWLETQRAAAQHLAFVIGGPDGLAREVLARGRKLWSLSRLTLPHALVRVVLAEQLYRAAMVLAGHPYHRAGRA